MTTELLFILLRRRGGWLDDLIDLGTQSAAWWLPGPWWWYMVGIPVGVVVLRLIVAWVFNR